MTTMNDAIARYPPSVASRCSSRILCDPGCPKCLNVQPPATGTSSVRFQLTYTCDSAMYAPCYYPRPINCPPPECPPVNKINCCLKWIDCCGKPVSEYFRELPPQDGPQLVSSTGNNCDDRMACCPPVACTRPPRTVPPPCCHGPKPGAYVWPQYGCPPPQACPPPKRCCPPPPCPPLICRPRPPPPPRPRLVRMPECRPPPPAVPIRCPAPKMKPPASRVQFCIRNECGCCTYAPCYFSDRPECPPDCC